MNLISKMLETAVLLSNGEYATAAVHVVRKFGGFLAGLDWPGPSFWVHLKLVSDKLVLLVLLQIGAKEITVITTVQRVKSMTDGYSGISAIYFTLHNYSKCVAFIGSNMI